jgi:hypothetical protein
MSAPNQLSDQKSAAPLAIPERRTKRPLSQYPRLQTFSGSI